MTASDVLLFLLLPSSSGESSGLSPSVLMAVPISLVLFMHLISWWLPILYLESAAPGDGSAKGHLRMAMIARVIPWEH
ncbi:unnamed protein product [Linum trigynum]|uniref:Uncharacterized protein n=1 Tax=Linum trigynum TaxID=586398 RepID=A0AAV2CKC0_9ROSI